MSDPKTQAPDAPTANGVKVSANAAAVLIGDTLGRKVSAKQVRSVAREALPAYMDEGYTPHAYDRATLLTLLGLFAKRGAGRGTVAIERNADGTLSGDAVARAAGISAADLASAKGGK